MDKTELNNKIILKQKEVDLERDQNRKQELQRQLRILHLRMDIEETKDRIRILKKNTSPRY